LDSLCPTPGYTITPMNIKIASTNETGRHQRTFNRTAFDFFRRSTTFDLR